MNWDTEIWAPCRLGEAFTLREFRSERTEYLYSIKADWMGHRGDGTSVRDPHQLEGEYVHPIRVGIGPRPWANCWTYEPKIKITPPVWCWDMQDDTMFGLDLKLKRNGNRRKAKLDCVMIHEGRPVYRMVIETSDGPSHRYYDSIPVLDPHFAPIWPAADDGTPPTVYVAPEPVADPVAERTPEKAEQTPDSGNSTDVAILLSAANRPAQADEDTLATWTGTENIPPGACIGGRTPINRNYYYYVWFEEPHTEGETYE